MAGANSLLPSCLAVWLTGAYERDEYAAIPGTVPEWLAIWSIVVLAGCRPEADIRHHGLGQSGARLVLHDRRLFGGHVHAAHRCLRAQRSVGLRRHAAGRYGGGGDRHTTTVRAQPS